MNGLVVRHFLEVGVEGVCEAGGNELGLSVVCETFAVELVFEVLQSKSIVQDVGCLGSVSGRVGFSLRKIQ